MNSVINIRSILLSKQHLTISCEKNLLSAISEIFGGAFWVLGSAYLLLGAGIGAGLFICKNKCNSLVRRVSTIGNATNPLPEENYVVTSSVVKFLQAAHLCFATYEETLPDFQNMIEKYGVSSEQTIRSKFFVDDNKQQYLLSATADRLYVCFRGSVNSQDWKTNRTLSLRNYFEGNLHQGFYDRANQIPIAGIVKLAIQKDLAITFSGHSLGGAVAMICTMLALKHCEDLSILVSIDCIAFGAPYIGDENFQKYVNRNGLTRLFLNFINHNDNVPGILNLPSTQTKANNTSKALSDIVNVAGHALGWMTGVAGISYAVEFYNMARMVFSNYLKSFCKQVYCPSSVAIFLESNESGGYEWNCIYSASIIVKLLTFERVFDPNDIIEDHLMSSYLPVLEILLSSRRNDIDSFIGAADPSADIKSIISDQSNLLVECSLFGTDITIVISGTGFEDLINVEVKVRHENQTDVKLTTTTIDVKGVIVANIGNIAVSGADIVIVTVPSLLVLDSVVLEFRDLFNHAIA